MLWNTSSGLLSARLQRSIPCGPVARTIGCQAFMEASCSLSGQIRTPLAWRSSHDEPAGWNCISIQASTSPWSAHSAEPASFLPCCRVQSTRTSSWPRLSAAADKIAMQGMGERMRARARDLGWSDAEVARRLGLAQNRYANYVTDRHEPDLATLVRICLVLGTSPDWLLGATAPSQGADDQLKARISACVQALDGDSLAVASTVLDALLARAKSMVLAEPETQQRRVRRPAK